MLWYYLISLVITTILNYNCHATTIKIGAIFDTENESKEKAFLIGVEELNKMNLSVLIEPLSRKVPIDDSYETMVVTRSLIEQDVLVILGPSTQHNSKMAQSLCDFNDIFYLDVRWVKETRNSRTNFYPDQEILNQAYLDIIQTWEYRDVVILYENEESFRRIASMLQIWKLGKFFLRQLDDNTGGNYRSVLKEVRQSGARHFLLDCSAEILEEVLRQAQQVGLMTDEHFFFITNLDLQTIDLTPFQYSGTNITGVRIFNPDTDSVRDLALKTFEEEITDNGLFALSAPWKLQVETVLVVDALMMFGTILKGYFKIIQETPRVKLGTTIANLLKGAQYEGYAGLVYFDINGNRAKFSLDVLEVQEGGLIKIGSWNEKDRLQVNRPVIPPDEDSNKLLRDKHFRVVFALLAPFAMYKPAQSSLSGNDQYQGYAIDLIKELADMEGFNYTFINQEDKRNGEFNEKLGKWDGMIGAIHDDVADLAIGDLTITSDRQKVIDFTSPFMNLGISILYQKPKKAPPSFFSFADPFALEVWILVAISFFTVSILLFILGRISSTEWSNPYPCIEEPEFLVNQLSMRNCFWFVSGSIMQQGSEIGPIAVSTRMVAGMWWFFTLIMVSSYTANLAAFLTKEIPDPHFSNVYELVANAEKKGIRWGAKEGGSTLKFFNSSRDQIKEYGTIFDYMMENKDTVLFDNTEEGVREVEKGNYAFFMEITSIEYEIQRRCSLTSVGTPLDEKSYGIAMKQNSTYRNVLSRAILDLQHSGKLDELKRKWWEENQGGGFCASEDESSQATALNLKNVGGVFWVTIGGVLIAVLLVIIEMILHITKRSFKTKVSVSQCLMEEFQFFFKFSKMEKPVIYNESNNETLNDVDL